MLKKNGKISGTKSTIVLKENKIMQETNQMGNQADVNTIKDIVVSEIFFEIPSYQRLYEWEEEQIETLLEDIKKAKQGEQEGYFIGNVVVSKKNEKYILIDGQQRLTTLWLIGFYLAHKLNNDLKQFIIDGENLRISMPLREIEENALRELATNLDDFDKFETKAVHSKIIRAFKCIKQWFEKNDNKGLLSVFIVSHVRFVLVKLADNTDLNQFFVRMNNRGKQLEKHEILKARLLGILQKGDESDEWKKYAKIWDLCSDMNKYIFQSVSDRKILNNNSEEYTQTEDNQCGIDDIVANYKISNRDLNNTQDDEEERFRSLVDFPTFLLHVAKLYQSEQEQGKKNILGFVAINKDKLLEMFDQKLNLNIEQVKDFICKLLKYRILFDYAVIKRNEEKNEYAIRKLQKIQKGKNENAYYQVSETEVAPNLAMIQNYLRVARAGDKQNYHHWLTAFLKKLSTLIKIEVKIEDEKIVIQNNKTDFIEIVKYFEDSPERVELVLNEFLEDWDTALAKIQFGYAENQVELQGKLIGANDYWLSNFDNKTKELYENLPRDFLDTKNTEFSFLDQGTNTPHYWFYRLEYYLWKGGDSDEAKKRDENQIDEIGFATIRQNYRFRGLNSVEHIWPQSKKEEWEQKEKESNSSCEIDGFGNLALISQSFNSSLSDQSIEKKFVDVKERVRDNRVESLKMCLAYIKCEGESSKWTPKTAQKHQEEMIKILIDSFEATKNNSED